MLDPELIRPLDDDAAELIQQAVTEHLACNPRDYVPFTRDLDYIGPLPVAEEFQKYSLENSVVAKKAAESSHVIQGEVERAFRARSAARWNPGQRKGKINRGALHRIATGDDRVFRTKLETQTKDVAVQLVIDCSGSMRFQKIDYAAIAAYMLASVLEKVNVSSEVLGFTTIHDALPGIFTRQQWDEFVRQVHAEGYTRSTEYARYCPLAIFTFKEFQQRFDERARKTLGFLPSAARYMGANADGESIEIAAMRLRSRKEARKVMIVMSDGQPASDGDHYMGVAKLKQVVQDMNKSGIEVYGLGLMDTSVLGYYDKAEVVTKAEEIPVKILALLQKILVG